MSQMSLVFRSRVGVFLSLSGTPRAGLPPGRGFLPFVPPPSRPRGPPSSTTSCFLQPEASALLLRPPGSAQSQGRSPSRGSQGSPSRPSPATLAACSCPARPARLVSAGTCVCSLSAPPSSRRLQSPARALLPAHQGPNLPRLVRSQKVPTAPRSLSGSSPSVREVPPLLLLLVPSRLPSPGRVSVSHPLAAGPLSLDDRAARCTDG